MRIMGFLFLSLFFFLVLFCFIGIQNWSSILLTFANIYLLMWWDFTYFLDENLSSWSSVMPNTASTHKYMLLTEHIYRTLFDSFLDICLLSCHYIAGNHFQAKIIWKFFHFIIKCILKFPLNFQWCLKIAVKSGSLNSENRYTEKLHAHVDFAFCFNFWQCSI